MRFFSLKNSSKTHKKKFILSYLNFYILIVVIYYLLEQKINLNNWFFNTTNIIL